MTTDRREFDTKPKWFIDEMDELRSHIDTKASNEKVDHAIKIQDLLIKLFIAMISIGATAVAGLYVMYYSGLGELKIQVQVMDSKLTGVKEDVTNIKAALSSAEITK